MMLRNISGVIALLLAATCWADENAAAQNQYLYMGRDASALVASNISGLMAAGDIKVSIATAREEDVITSASTPITAELQGLDVDKPTGTWHATLYFTTSGKNLPPVRLAGRFDEITQVPVLKHRMNAGEVISEADIDVQGEPNNQVHKAIVTDAKDLVGKSAKHMISQGRPIRLDEVASPAVVAKGTHVTIFFKSDNLEIKTLGEALDNGAKGDMIRVKNLASKTIIEGRVEGGNSVRVSSTEDTSASAAEIIQ